MNNMKFDSDVERDSAPVILPLGYRRCGERENFERKFYDSNNESFDARPDFYPLTEDFPILEVKGKDLNSITSKESARKARNRAIEAFKWKHHRSPYSGKELTYIGLNNDWNHSARKHSIVSGSMSPLDYVIVYDIWPSEDGIKRMAKLGITWCMLDSLQNFLRVRELALAGICCAFVQDDPNGKREVSQHLYGIRHSKTRKYSYKRLEA